MAGMANDPGAQNFKNHAKFVPLFHFVAVPILVIEFRLVRLPGLHPAGLGYRAGALVAAALVILAFLARIFALRVQDRVIRLEMRLRLRELLPADLHPRIAEFTPGQLVALRFAGDRELPALARRVLDERQQDRRAIKQMISDWQADHFRV